MPWIYLAVAIISEVLATSALKASDGMTRFFPSVLVVVGYGVSFYFLSMTLRTIPVGVAYAIWSGVGVVLMSLVGWLLYCQKLDTATILGIAMIASGVIVLHLFSKPDDLPPGTKKPLPLAIRMHDSTCEDVR
jgi:small multidrug resistance pump